MVVMRALKLCRGGRISNGSSIARALVAATAVVGLAFACISGAPAANNSVQGGAAKKADGGFDSGAPFAILIEAESGSVLYEKNADQLTAPSNMQKLMTAEVV